MVDNSDLVGTWDLPLSDGVHKIEFEHGTTSGKRVIRVDGKEIFRKDWMFKLVGRETFKVGKATCIISIEAVSGFAYEYVLEVNGKPLKKFKDNQSKIQKAWLCCVKGENCRICLEKSTMDIWVNGQKVEAAPEFGDEGTEYYFVVNGHSAVIRAERGHNEGKKKTSIIHRLYLNDDFSNEIPASSE